MGNFWTNIHLVVFLFISFFMIAPLAQAQELIGDAVFKDLTIENDGKEVQVDEPIIYFEGKSYIPLRAVAKSLGKGIIQDESTNQIVLGGVLSNEGQADQHRNNASYFRPNVTMTEDVSSSGAIILEDHEKNIMFAKNGHLRYYPASTTKILTALLALEYGQLDDNVVITEDVKTIPSDSSKAFLNPGDQLTLEQLLYSLLLPSGNDSGVAIAVHIAGSEEAFVKLMNEKAKELGAKNSNFMNSHGYHHPEHYTTPYDLALILKAASEYPIFLEMIKTQTFKAVYQDRNREEVTKYWRSTNGLITDTSFFVDGVIGGKTGYTDRSKHTLATVAEHDGHRYVVVTLEGSRNGRYIDTKRLLMKAYHARKTFDNLTAKKIKVKFVNPQLVMDGKIYQATEPLFVYKGRTYIAQTSLKTIVEVEKVETVHNSQTLVGLSIKLEMGSSISPQLFSLDSLKRPKQPMTKENYLAHDLVKIFTLSHIRP